MIIYKIRRFALIAIVLSAILASIVGLITWQSLPRSNGTVFLPEAIDAMTIKRDDHGVPFIRANNEGDAYFALGYVHAQDRLFQMDFMRRLGAGKISEVLGARGLGSDRFMRTLGLYRHAKANLSFLDEETIYLLERYTAGINAWMENRTKPLPPEFQMLQYTPEPWVPADSLIWQKLMTLSLAGNWREELLRSELLQVLSPEQILDLWPDSALEDITTFSSAQTIPSNVTQELGAAIDTYAPPTLASNVWALDGQHTVSGKPLLASDPHLGFQAPLVWYLAHMSWPGGTRVGATTPGVPLFMIGHNGSIAWGVTTTHADLQDLFIERLTEDDQYHTPEGPMSFEQRTEVIKVRFKDPVLLNVRLSRHGPVVSDLSSVSQPLPDSNSSNRTVLALAATVLRDDDRSASGIDRLSRAKNVDEARNALALFEQPQLNFVYADVLGGIGYTAAAKVPVRREGNGTVPVPGDTGVFDWDGWIPYENLPHIIRPESGRLVNANNRPMPAWYPYLLAASFPEDYRAERINERLDDLNGTKASMEDMRKIQLDTQSTMAKDLLPLLLSKATPKSPAGQDALTRLAGWDGTMDRNRPEPLLFLTWSREVKRALLKDELGPTYQAFNGGRIRLLKSILTNQRHWCDDIKTLALESCSHAVSEALDAAAVWLAERPETQGLPMGSWRWGLFHKAHFGHTLFGLLPGLANLTSVELETDGSDHTVNRGGFRSDRGLFPFRHGHGAGLRAIFDLDHLDRSLFIIALGQSGHPASKNYSNLATIWRNGGMFTLPFSGPEQSNHTLTLQPLSKSLKN
ncbi:MAG: penicillin acylase family protein [Rhodospirillaceae bacterium]